MKEFDSIRADGILYNWKASLIGGKLKAPKLEVWVPPMEGVFNFNVDGVARSKPSLAGIGWLFAIVVVMRLLCFLNTWALWNPMRRRFWLF